MRSSYHGCFLNQERIIKYKVVKEIFMKSFVQKNKIIFALIPFIFLGISNISFNNSQWSEITSVELGEKLFFDPILSSDHSISCASCHKPEFAFADNIPLSNGVNSKFTSRNTPSVMYSDARLTFFWDGRAQSLEHQAFFPITNPNEMNLPEDEAIRRLNESEFYTNAFMKVFNDKPKKIYVSKALADYQKSLRHFNSPYDRFTNGDDTAISASAIRGIDLFNTKAKCSNCHGGRDKTDDAFFNIGLYNGKEYNDKGRFDITKDTNDLGRFKTPLLRNTELTAPYMHDGSMETLDEVLEYYNNPDEFVNNSKARDTLLNKPLGLTKQEIQDLKAFMLALTDENLK